MNSVLSYFLTILLPPVGIILLWLNPAAGIIKKILLTFVLIFWTMVEITLFLFIGVMTGFIIPNGAMTGIEFNFTSETGHLQRLEESRQTVAAPEADGISFDFSAYWTGFRGPNRDGVYDQIPIQTEWPEDGLTPLWKQPIGAGYGSFAVVNGVAFTVEQRLEEEVLVAYDILTGAERWTHSWEGAFWEPLGGPGPRSTPTYDNGRLYTLGALGEFWCNDADTGEVIWNKNILSEFQLKNQYYGIAHSPLIHEDTVIVHTTGGDENAVVAYTKETGDKVWSVISDTQEYVSPQYITFGEQKHIVTITTDRIIGLNPDDGALLWEFPWKRNGAISISQPIQVPGDRIFVSGGYGRGCVMLQVDPTTTPWTVTELWMNRNMKNKLSSSVYLDGYIYGLDEGVLVCLDAETGDRAWKAGRYGHGQLLLADGHLIILSERGDLVLIDATPEAHTERVRFAAIEGKTWNVPAIADGYLLIRNSNEMACYEIADDTAMVP